MEGLDVDEALEWMRQYGFELGGLDMRVMGLQEVIDELQREIRALEQRYHLDRATRGARAAPRRDPRPRGARAARRPRPRVGAR